MKTITIIIGLAAVFVWVMYEIELRRRQAAEARAEALQASLDKAQARLDAMTKMQTIQKEARHEADKKIDEVRSTGGSVRFNSIMDELFHIESPDSD